MLLDQKASEFSKRVGINSGLLNPSAAVLTYGLADVLTNEGAVFVRDGHLVGANGVDAATRTLPETVNVVLDFAGPSFETIVLPGSADALITTKNLAPGRTKKVRIINLNEGTHGAAKSRYVGTPSGWKCVEGGDADLLLLQNEVGLITIDSFGADDADCMVQAQSGSWVAPHVSYSSNHTLDISDRGYSVWMDKATPVSLTVPLGYGDLNWRAIRILNVGVGQVTVVAVEGVTVNTAKTLKLRGQGAHAWLIRNDTNDWDLVGDLAEA